MMTNQKILIPIPAVVISRIFDGTPVDFPVLRDCIGEGGGR